MNVGTRGRAVAVGLATVALLGCGRTLPEQTENVPDGGDVTDAFGQSEGRGVTIRVAAAARGVALARAAARSFQAEEPGVRVTVAEAAAATALERLCAGDAGVAIADGEPATCEGTAPDDMVVLQVARAGATRIAVVTTRGRLEQSFETESFVTYVIDENGELARHAGLQTLTPEQLEETQSTLNDVLAGLG